ncbi:hypothetical protein ACN28S_50050 [Cystobacter fuscus]
MWNQVAKRGTMPSASEKERAPTSRIAARLCWTMGSRATIPTTPHSTSTGPCTRRPRHSRARVSEKPSATSPVRARKKPRNQPQ